MEEKTGQNSFEITLADGTRLSGLELNGNNFISKTKITESTFSGKLSHVIISGNSEYDDAGLIGEHENMELIKCKQYGQDYYFILRDIPQEKLQQMRIDARLDYIEMMEDL